MAKSIKVIQRPRGRPATGRDKHITARFPDASIADVDAWAVSMEITRSEAFRRLVELGLKAKR
jgi:hypothetical protein